MNDNLLINDALEQFLYAIIVKDIYLLSCSFLCNLRISSTGLQKNLDVRGITITTWLPLWITNSNFLLILMFYLEIIVWGKLNSLKQSVDASKESVR